MAFKVVATPWGGRTDTDYPYEHEALRPLGITIAIARADSDAEYVAQVKDADAIMVGRGAQGRPWFPGALARYLTTGRRDEALPLDRQCAMIAALYQEMLTHYGIAVGLRHARKHLGWALDVAAAQARAPLDFLKQVRARVLTADQPAAVLARLGEAFDAFGARLAA